MGFSESFSDGDGVTLFFVALGGSSLCFFLYMLAPFIFKAHIEEMHINSQGKKSFDACRFDWSSRFVSICFTLFAFPVALAIISDDAYVKDRVSHRTPLGLTLIAMASGYFIFDLAISALFDTVIFIVHAAYCLVTFTWALFIGPHFIIWYLAGCLLMEGSTVFMQFRWYLIQRKMADTFAFKVINICFGASFLTLRIGWTVYLVVMSIIEFYVKDRSNLEGDEKSLPHLSFRIYTTFGILLGLSLNLFWMRAILKGVKRKSTAISPDELKNHEEALSHQIEENDSESSPHHDEMNANTTNFL